MPFFSRSHAGSATYGSPPSSLIYGSPPSNVIYPSSSYSSSSYEPHYAPPLPPSNHGSYYGLSHYSSRPPVSVPVQHNFYGAPPVVMQPRQQYITAPTPSYHHRSYSAPYGYPSPYYGGAQPAVIVASRSSSSSRHHRRSSSGSSRHKRYYYL